MLTEIQPITKKEKNQAETGQMPLSRFLCGVYSKFLPRILSNLELRIKLSLSHWFIFYVLNKFPLPTTLLQCNQQNLVTSIQCSPM